MRHITALCGAAWLFVSPLAGAGEVYDGVEYISGKTGFDKKMKGRLIIEPGEIGFTNASGEAVFTIPLSTVKKVTNSIEEDPGSTGRKLLLGVFASKKEEFLYVTSETRQGAEAVVFKCKKKTSPGIVAKIEFNVQKLKGVASK